MSESHLFKCVLNTINNIKNSSKTVDIQNNLHKPDIVFNRTKDNIIEEISFYKKGEVANPILYIATKARYYKNGKFFRDGSKSGFLFSKNGYLLINDRPHCYLKFNKKNISLNYYANSRDKYDRKITISLPFIDCSFEKSASTDTPHS